MPSKTGGGYTHGGSTTESAARGTKIVTPYGRDNSAVKLPNEMGKNMSYNDSVNSPKASK